MGPIGPNRVPIPQYIGIRLGPRLQRLRPTDFYTKLTLWFHTILTHRHFGVPGATFVSRALASKYINEHHTFIRTQLYCVYILCANFHMKTRTQKS